VSVDHTRGRYSNGMPMYVDVQAVIEATKRTRAQSGTSRTAGVSSQVKGVPESVTPRVVKAGVHRTLEAL
jgi:hypothetical protein